MSAPEQPQERETEIRDPHFMGGDSYFRLDPRALVTAPFTQCPSCGDNEFGLLMIDGKAYTRRCRACLHQRRFELPPIKKRVIFLDQFAISNLMFALNPSLPQQARVQQYYYDLFDLLDSLVKHQLIVCPASPTHYAESIVSKHYVALARMGEHLANGTSFWDASEIRRFQLCVHCGNWARGEQELEPVFDTEQFVQGALHDWSDRILITVERRATPTDIEAVRDHRGRISEGLQAAFSRWQTEHLTFEERFQQELRSFGPPVFRQYQRFYQDLEEVRAGQREPSIETLLPSTSVLLVNTMCIALQGQGMSREESFDAVTRYLHSDALRHTASLRISSMLWAALARKAESGQKRPPTQGMSYDVDAASAVLPYVDAAFVDNEVRGLLSEEPIRSGSGIRAQLFSPNNVDALLAYLCSILDDAPAAHLELARSVYGEDGLRPYWEMFEGGNV